MRSLLVAFICLFSLPVHAAQRDNLSAWFVDSLVKVFPDNPAETSSFELGLVTARNGHSSLQVALRSESHQLVRVRVAVSGRSLRGSRAEGTKALGDELALVRTRADDEALSPIEIRSG